MGILNIFGKKSVAEQVWRVGGMEDFMTLIRVYYQAVMAANLGINNLAALPDLRLFKQTLHVPTVNNKLGLGERNRCKKLLSEIYRISDNFFKEIDMSIKRNCKNLNSVQPYFFAFQGFSQELMMVMGNLMKWKFRVPGIMKNGLRTMTQKTVNDVLTKDNWKKDDVRKACMSVRQYQQKLGYSGEWMAEYVYNIVILAKKEPKPKDVEEKNAKKYPNDACCCTADTFRFVERRRNLIVSVLLFQAVHAEIKQETKTLTAHLICPQGKTPVNSKRLHDKRGRKQPAHIGNKSEATHLVIQRPGS